MNIPIGESERALQNHSKGFIAYMDTCLPYWRETKNKLNTLTLDYIIN
jgi:predicted metal-dependent hydrolase